MDRAVFGAWGITPEAFDQALVTCETDDDIVQWLHERVSSEQRKAANRHLLTERIANLDKQDAEEVVGPAA